MTALSGDAPERNPATTPQRVIYRIALPSASAAPAWRDQTPAQASARRAVGTAAASTRGHSRRAITGMTRAWNLVPAETCSPTTSDHTCASQKTSIDTNPLPVKVRASAPASNVAPTTGRHQERAVHSRSIADVSLAGDMSHASQLNSSSTETWSPLGLPRREYGHGVVEGQAPRGKRSSRSSCDCPHESRKAHDDPSPRRRGVSGSPNTKEHWACLTTWS
jgi:hypothetical protein